MKYLDTVFTFYNHSLSIDIQGTDFSAEGSFALCLSSGIVPTLIAQHVGLSRIKTLSCFLTRTGRIQQVRHDARIAAMAADTKFFPVSHSVKIFSASHSTALRTDRTRALWRSKIFYRTKSIKGNTMNIRIINGKSYCINGLRSSNILRVDWNHKYAY